jgi:hypothetical protein
VMMRERHPPLKLSSIQYHPRVQPSPLREHLLFPKTIALFSQPCRFIIAGLDPQSTCPSPTHHKKETNNHHNAVTNASPTSNRCIAIHLIPTTTNAKLSTSILKGCREAERAELCLFLASTSRDECSAVIC